MQGAQTVLQVILRIPIHIVSGIVIIWYFYQVVAGIVKSIRRLSKGAVRRKSITNTQKRRDYVSIFNIMGT